MAVPSHQALGEQKTTVTEWGTHTEIHTMYSSSTGSGTVLPAAAADVATLEGPPWWSKAIADHLDNYVQAVAEWEKKDTSVESKSDGPLEPYEHEWASPFPKPQLAHWFHLVPPPWACCDDLWVCITGETRFSGEGEWKPTYSDAYPSAHGPVAL